MVASGQPVTWKISEGKQGECLRSCVEKHAALHGLRSDGEAWTSGHEAHLGDEVGLHRVRKGGVMADLTDKAGTKPFEGLDRCPSLAPKRRRPSLDVDQGAPCWPQSSKLGAPALRLACAARIRIPQRQGWLHVPFLALELTCRMQ
eukprot:CAMPEP_0204171184 /NCGR_PEP_ID=MMETSP0361-20130328/43013_1 /ASSEMBLY_ACC=CAM_ASM_000343 /TAXON_ID=268821 /ORGANISM="Scrippsiella Hangoei, Strain SHTV-5" /LENGTH=145 /DNA_ID=CAMNT_0051129027 /DNA_START=61 /DNA_END=498 /DNA_ORIENTATION=+